MAEVKKVEPAKPQDRTKPKFLKEKLRENCIELFGVTTSTFDGAMYGHDEKEYTVDEVKKIIENY
jgi:hypothetical protein